jgi:hypothetical protein
MITIKSQKQSRLTWKNIQAWEEVVDGAALLDELRDIFRNYVVLPKWGAEMLDELRDIFRNYVVLPKWGAEMLALWTVHTYAWQLREVTTYVGVSSPEKRCGKTTLLGVLSKLAHRPVAAANISPPALFRVIEESEPTLLIDEADTFLQGNEELRGILNAGYSRETAYVVRVANNYQVNESQDEEKPKEDPYDIEGLPASEVMECRDGTLRRIPRKDASTECRPTEPRTTRLARFSCWCPKVMAAIGRLPETLADRCILVRMQRKTAREECERLKALEGSVLRRKCTRFVKDHEGEISVARPEVPKGLNDRAADIWEPLLALADLAGGEWPRLAREAAQGLHGAATDSNATGVLLIHIWVLFDKSGVDRMFSRDLVATLNEYGHRPWAEGLKGELVDEVWLAKQLRRYGVQPKTMWIKGVIAKGYFREEFADVFGRYITKADLEEVKGKVESDNGQDQPKEGVVADP